MFDETAKAEDIVKATEGFSEEDIEEFADYLSEVKARFETRKKHIRANQPPFTYASLIMLAEQFRIARDADS